MPAIRFAAGLLATGLALAPALAADLGPPVMYAPAYEAEVLLPEAPYYVVNQGPVHSGPGIVVDNSFLVNTDVRLDYPFIGVVGRVAPVWSHGRRGRREPVLRSLGSVASGTRHAGIARGVTGSATTPRARRDRNVERDRSAVVAGWSGRAPGPARHVER